MSQWNIKGRTDDAVILATLEWTKSMSPIVGIMADTKVGKTTWLSKLFAPVQVQVEHEGRIGYVKKTCTSYKPTLYIDADAGEATIGHLIDDENRVDHLAFDGHPDTICKWVTERLREAESAQCGAIVIEVVNAVFELELARARAANPSEKELFKLAKEPSGELRAIFSQIRRLKLVRKANGIGVPIFVSLNVKGVQVGKAPNTSTKLVPNMSDNLRRHFVAAADALVELTRVPQNNTTNLIAWDPDPNPTHAIRGPSGSSSETLARLVNENNLDPVGLLALWADFKNRNTPKRLQPKSAQESQA